MGQSIVVHVLDSDGDAVEGTKVTIDIEGISKGGRLSEYTDEDGHAEFETAGDYDESNGLMIFVGVEEFGPYEIGAGPFTVQLE